MPRLPSALDGLTITHMSDLHFTGALTRNFYEELVKEANQLKSDVVVITGDIIDKEHCLEWIPGVLGQLQADEGVFAILGNHELRCRHDRR